MGQKVNYNKNKTNKLKVAIIVVVSLLVIIILVKSFIDVTKSLKNEQKPPTAEVAQTTVKNYNTLEALLKGYNCNVLSKEETNDFITIKLVFGEKLYDGETSNETYFTNVCKGVAEFIKYKNFRLLDESNNIDIEVKCEKPNIVEMKINNDVNYYLNHNSEINSRKRTNKVTEFTIQSEELKSLNDTGWNESYTNFGTKESTCNGYNIYFDEGIRYRTVARNIFNVIFTSEYKGEVAGGLDVNSSKETVETALGAPTFKYGENIYGYLGSENYLFFDFVNNEISTYPVVSVTEDEESQLKSYIEKMNETNDLKKFVTDLTGYWLDFDIYNYDANYVDLRYTLKGIKISVSSDSLKNGIFIYNNYSGNMDIKELGNVYVENSDFVFDTEKARNMNESLQRIEQGDFTDEQLKELGIDFSVRFESFGENSFIGPKFYSRDKSYPDSELGRTSEISSYKWYGDEDKNYLFIYSVNDAGIYVYNCQTRVSAEIIKLDGDIIITSAKDGVISYTNNDEQKEINVAIN